MVSGGRRPAVGRRAEPNRRWDPQQRGEECCLVDDQESAVGSRAEDGLRKLVHYIGVSLDGRIAGPGGEFDFSPQDR